MYPQLITFSSEGEQLEALLYLPEDREEPHPVVVMGGGWCYVKELVQPKYAEVFALFGLGSLIFDYRNFGGSTGKPRQHLNPWGQWDDYRNAISLAERHPKLDNDRIAIWGISYSGGHVLAVGALDPRVRAIVSVVPVIDGYENMRLAHGTLSLRRLNERVMSARRHLSETGNHSYIPHALEDQTAEVPTWPFPSSEPMFKRLKDSQAPAYENRTTVASVEMLLAYNVLPYARRLNGTAALIVLAEGDDHTHWDLALNAYNSIPNPDKRLYVVPRSTHHSIYEDDSQLHLAAESSATWLAEHFNLR